MLIGYEHFKKNTIIGALDQILSFQKNRFVCFCFAESAFWHSFELSAAFKGKIKKDWHMGDGCALTEANSNIIVTEYDLGTV